MGNYGILPFLAGGAQGFDQAAQSAFQAYQQKDALNRENAQNLIAMAPKLMDSRIKAGDVDGAKSLASMITDAQNTVTGGNFTGPQWASSPEAPDADATPDQQASYQSQVAATNKQNLDLARTLYGNQPQTVLQDLGGSVVAVKIDPDTHNVMSVSTVPGLTKTVTPGEQLSADTRKYVADAMAKSREDVASDRLQALLGGRGTTAQSQMLDRERTKARADFIAKNTSGKAFDTWWAAHGQTSTLATNPDLIQRDDDGNLTVRKPTDDDVASRAKALGDYYDQYVWPQQQTVSPSGTTANPAAATKALSAVPQTLQPIVANASDKIGVPAPLIAATMGLESGGNNASVSDAGAVGTMQIMPSTAADIQLPWKSTKGINPKDPTEAIPGGAVYLKEGHDQAVAAGVKNDDDAWKFALAYYHGGPGALHVALKGGTTWAQGEAALRKANIGDSNMLTADYVNTIAGRAGFGGSAASPSPSPTPSSQQAQSTQAAADQEPSTDTTKAQQSDISVFNKYMKKAQSQQPAQPASTTPTAPQPTTATQMLTEPMQDDYTPPAKPTKQQKKRNQLLGDYPAPPSYARER